MKKLLLIITILSFSFSFAQFIPMLEQGNSWNMVGLDGFGGPPSNIVLAAMGNTEVINGVTYTIVDNADCKFREQDGKLFAYWSSDNSEYLLYDFNLEVGDIVDVSPAIYTDCRWILDTYIDEMTVSAKSVQFIAGEDRIVIELEAFGSYTESWIEGIGSTTGFFPNGEGLDSASRLTCFAYQGNTYFFNGYTECIVLGLEGFDKEEIVLYPNPVQDKSILQLPETASIDKIKIFNLSGKLIKEELITENYFTIDSMDYPSGLYFYQVSSNDRLKKTSKFVVK